MSSCKHFSIGMERTDHYKTHYAHMYSGFFPSSIAKWLLHVENACWPLSISSGIQLPIQKSLLLASNQVEHYATFVAQFLFSHSYSKWPKLIYAKPDLWIRIPWTETARWSEQNMLPSHCMVAFVEARAVSALLIAHKLVILPAERSQRKT